MSEVVFFVRGQPSTKGSARAFVVKGRAIVTNDAGPKAKTWAGLVSDAAAEATRHLRAVQGSVFGGPVEVAVTFYLPRPASHYLSANRTRPVPVLRSDAPVFASSKPDGDKLERCAWDALTGIVFTDDSRIARWTGEKRYADPESVGARFMIRPLAEVLP